MALGSVGHTLIKNKMLRGLSAVVPPCPHAAHRRDTTSHAAGAAYRDTFIIVYRLPWRLTHVVVLGQSPSVVHLRILHPSGHPNKYMRVLIHFKYRTFSSVMYQYELN